MANSSIRGIEPTPQEPAGRDAASLGPGDSSDSGSDMMGIADSGGGDPNLPIDVALRGEHGSPPPDALNSASDAAGTGESRSAGGDGGLSDGWDIGTDRVISLDAPTDADEVDPDLAFTDEFAAEDALLDAAVEEDASQSEGEDDGDEAELSEPPLPGPTPP